ncbi:MAG: class I adenylate-forming enzyme family protein [Gemmobacter sp.]
MSRAALAVAPEGGSRWPPPPAPFNLAAHALGQALGQAPRLGSKCALEILGPARVERWRFDALAAAVLAAGGGLRAAGIAPGARIALRLGNTVDFPILFLGAIAAGIVPVPLAAALTAPEVARALGVLRPAAILADPTLALPEAPGCAVIAGADLGALRAHAPCTFEMGDPDRPAYGVFTSGTSGQSRAVIHAHRALWARGMMHAGWYGLTEGDRLMHAGAFNWTFTLGTGLLDPWSVGATALIPAAGVTPAQIGLLLARHEATLFAAAPGVLRQMLRAGLPALPRLRHALVAGEKLPEALRAAWQAATGTALHEAFGMSECSTFISSCPDRPAPPGAIGHAQPGRRVAIVSDEGAPVARGAEGIIAVARDDPGLFLGYLDAPEETAARFRGAWFLTGDRGVMADDGAIAYLGRDDDMMNAGGFRVSPLEVEAAMASCPGIEECAAVEVEVRPDVRVIALYYTAAEELDIARLTAHAGTRLARFRQPRLYRHIAELPRGANNKILRRALRAMPVPAEHAGDDRP